jgi:hypothetical protein
MRRIKIPQYAKEQARRALSDRDKFSNKPGLTKSQASRLGINSGVERAKQIVNNKYLPEEDARRVGAFYDRFKNKRTPRSEVAIGLWGGRRFGRSLARKF